MLKEKSISKYNFKEIEQKWKEKWKVDKVHQPDLDKARKPFYNLMMFPYPSAEGLHIGGVYTFTGVDTFGRFKKMQGYDVFEPIGLDGFGIHSENYAMKIGEHIKQVSERTEKNFYRQLSSIGNMYDWSRTVETYKPEYYKWTQWLFLQLFKKGLAYQKKAKVNWCPWCKTVLSDEQVLQGFCERCESQVEKKELKQWFFKITDYAERLLKNLDWIDWSEDVKTNQRNWIGKSEGAIVKFSISNKQYPINDEKISNVIIIHGSNLTKKESESNKNGPENLRHWKLWLENKLKEKGIKVSNELYPRDWAPKYSDWKNKFEKINVNENSILIGHSAGGAFLVRWLSETKTKIKKLILVSPGKSGKQSREILVDLYGNKTIKNIGKYIKNQIVIFTSDNDILKHIEGAEEYKKELPAKIVNLKNHGHFTIQDIGTEEFPELLNEILKFKLINNKISEGENCLEVFTTRPDTLFGATYMVLAPEHQLIEELKDKIENWEEVKKYITQAKAKSEQERKEDEKSKTGVEVKGIKAINPVNRKEIPIWIADYVLAGYGTGAIMAVPAHDERDFEFAKKYDIEIKEVVAPQMVITGEGSPRSEESIVCFDGVTAIIKHWEEDKYFAVEFKTGQKGFVGGRVEKNESYEDAIIREINEESGYKEMEIEEVLFKDAFSRGYKSWKSQEEFCHERIFVLKLKSDKKRKVDDKNIYGGHWMSSENIFNDNFFSHHKYYLQIYLNKNRVFSDKGVSINSRFLDGLKTEDAKKKMLEWLEEKNLGEKSIDYKLRDWCVSRQRYWGPPIPIIHCEKCGTVPVSEKDLPVELPEMEDFLPEGKGKGPLAKNKDFIKTTCPKCGEPAERETDVSDPFVDSAWYFLRYPSTEFDDTAINQERTKKWLPVDSYIGGKEHTVLHLLYSRFITMVFNDLGYIDFEEPYKRFFGHGLITKDGAKMSKSKGNVISPDEMIEKYGVDVVRLYLRFLGDFSQGGDWRDNGADGMARFVNKLWQTFFELKGEGQGVKKTQMIDKTVKAIGEDLEKLSFNTAVARYMEFLNWIRENINNFNENQTQKIKEILALLIAPMAPHIAEEFWKSLGNERSIFNKKWPEYNKNNLEDDQFELVIQINGKLRDKIKVSRKINEEEAKKISQETEKIKKHLTSKTPKKIIYIKEKLINIVI